MGRPGLPLAPSSGTITFYARYPDPSNKSWFGHIWISISGVGAYGFYPSGVKLETVPGFDLRHEWSKSQEQLNRAVDVVRSYSGPYLLIIDNCISLCREAAQAVGLSAPSAIGKSPAEWLGDLVVANM